MTVLDIGNNVAVHTQIVAQTLAASSADATAVDMKNVTWAIVHINAGTKAGTASAYTFKVEHSTDNATFTTCDKVGSAAGAEDATIEVTATPLATDERTYPSVSLAILTRATTTSPLLAPLSQCLTIRAKRILPSSVSSEGMSG